MGTTQEYLAMAALVKTPHAHRPKVHTRANEKVKRFNVKLPDDLAEAWMDYFGQGGKATRVKAMLSLVELGLDAVDQDPPGTVYQEPGLVISRVRDDPTIPFPLPLFERVLAFHFDRRVENKSAAIRILMRRGLAIWKPAYARKKWAGSAESR
jgi:hypothetical protein